MKENEVLRRRAEDSSSIILHNFSTNLKMEPNKLVYAKKTSVNADGIKCPIRALCPIHFDTECVDVPVIKENQRLVNADKDQLSELSEESVEFSEKEDGEWSDPKEEFGPYTPREDEELIVVELKKDENGVETRRVYLAQGQLTCAEHAKKRTSPDRTQDFPSKIRKKNHSKYSFYYSSIHLNCFLFSLLYSTPMSL